MASGCSLEALQWITHVQEFDKRLTNAAGERVQLAHAYHRGEHEEDGYKIDAYAEVDGKRYFMNI